jgi:LmbE family N-acetylglucosaminyl deacetylase
MAKIYTPESALVIAAHPDDIEYGCTGTLARWSKTGTRVSYVLCTSGEAGIARPGITLEEAARIREEEAREAAAIADVDEIVFLRYPDGMLQATMDLRRKLVREIRRFRPEVVLCFDPTVVWANEGYINHPDHRAAGLAAVDAAFPAAGQPLLYPEMANEGILPHKPRKVYVISWSGPDHFICIDETIDIKIAALNAHKSQMIDHDPEKVLREWASDAAKGKEMDYAEAFRVVTLLDEETWLKVKDIDYWKDLV